MRSKATQSLGKYRTPRKRLYANLQPGESVVLFATSPEVSDGIAKLGGTYTRRKMIVTDPVTCESREAILITCKTKGVGGVKFETRFEKQSFYFFNGENNENDTAFHL
jgi:hypothetical protein